MNIIRMDVSVSLYSQLAYNPTKVLDRTLWNTDLILLRESIDDQLRSTSTTIRSSKASQD
jgi:hypothetical protein